MRILQLAVVAVGSTGSELRWAAIPDVVAQSVYKQELEG